MRKSTLLILLIAAGLVAWLYFFELKKESPRDRPADDSTAAFTFAAADIVTLAVTRGGETVRLEKRGEEWRITRPLETRADPDAARALANAVAAARILRTLRAAGERLADYGLDAPVVALEAELASGEKHALRLGARDFTQTSVYALVDDGSEVVLLPAAVLSGADKSLDELRDRSVARFEEETLARIELRRASGAVVLVKAGEGKWVFEAPAAEKDKEARAWRLLDALRSARASEIFDAPPAQAAARLAQPAAELRLTGAEGRVTRVEVSSPVGDSVYARTSDGPEIYRLPKSLLESLQAPVADLLVPAETPS